MIIFDNHKIEYPFANLLRDDRQITEAKMYAQKNELRPK